MNRVLNNSMTKIILYIPLLFGLATTALAQSEGEKIYKARCMGCHAADGSADTKAGRNTGAHDFRLPDLEKEPDSSLIEIITKGKKKMPKFEEKLKGKEIKEVLEYVRGFYKKPS